MVSNKDKEMHTIKEWAKITGLKLINYDGYMDIYHKLSQVDIGDFYNNTVSRFSDAGDLLCTRDGFESGLLGCTMKVLTIEELPRIAEFIPRYAEFYIDLKLCDDTVLDKKISTQERVDTLKQILYMLEVKKSIRQRGIDRYGEEQVPLEQIDNKKANYNKLKLLFNKIKTVEDLELYLSDSITKEINNMLGSHDFNRLDKMFKDLRLLTKLHINSHRGKTDFNIEEQFIYVDSPYKKREDFELKYDMYGGDCEKTSGVVFYDSENNVSGAIMMPNADILAPDEERDTELKGKKSK